MMSKSENGKTVIPGSAAKKIRNEIIEGNRNARIGVMAMKKIACKFANLIPHEAGKFVKTVRKKKS